MLQTHALRAASKGRISLVTVLSLVWMAVWSGVASAQPAPPAPPAPLADNAVAVLPKTITYGVMAAAIDVAIGSVITGNVVTGTAMAAVATTSSWLLYQVHEMAWAQLEPADQSVPTKTVTFTVANTVRLFGIGMLFTQNVALSVSFVVLDGVGEAAAYVLTNRVWTYVVQPLVAKLPSEHAM
jgi:uncharacterized membrane protein